MQNQVDNEMRAWWEKFGASEKVHAGYMCKGNLGRNARRSMWRSWRHQVFGQDCFYRFLLAFGTIDNDMLEVTQEVCDERAAYRHEEIAAAGLQGDSADDMEWTIPVRSGINHIRSDAFILREKARVEERSFKAQEKRWKSDWVAGLGGWTSEQECESHTLWISRKRHVDNLWADALAASEASGYEYWDRCGVRQNKGKTPTFIEMAFERYLDRCDPKPKVIRK